MPVGYKVCFPPLERFLNEFLAGTRTTNDYRNASATWLPYKRLYNCICLLGRFALQFSCTWLCDRLSIEARSMYCLSYQYSVVVYLSSVYSV